LLIARTLTKFGFISATLGMLVLLLAPGYTYGVFIHHLDALRVFLFFAAIILCCEYVKQSSKSLFILATITAGMTLWSHSSGILLLLFYPLLALLLSSGESRYKILVKVLAILFFALIIGGDQYLSNLLRYGSPVFDQALIPPKFQSDYGMYLSQSYGFTDLASRIFKGALVEFYSVNQFGYVFWLLIPILLMKEFTSWRHKDYEDNLSHASSILIGTFIVMAIVSSLCGIEFFINSYRYSLILLPFAAYAVSTTNRVGLSVICLLVVLASAQGTVTQIEKYWHYAQTWKISDFSDEQSHTAKEGFLSGDLLDVAQKETSNTAKFLIFRPMEFWYYANRFGVRHTDPSLTSVYQANDVGSAYRALTELGISHVYSDKLRDPLYTMSELSSILDDPKYVSIISENNGYRILQLNNRENSSESSVAQEPTYSTGSQWISISFSNLPAATESRYMTIGCTVSAPSFVETYATEENANGEAIRTYRLARTFLNDHELNLKFMLNLSHVVTNVRLDFRGVLIDNTPSVHGCSAKIEF